MDKEMHGASGTQSQSMQTGPLMWR